MAKDDKRLPTPDVGVFVTRDERREKREEAKGGRAGKKYWWVTVVSRDEDGKSVILQHESHGKYDALGRLDKFQQHLLENFILHGKRPTKGDLR